MGCLIFTFINLIFACVWQWVPCLRPHPVCLGKAAWGLPFRGRGSGATSCLRRVYEASPTPPFLLITLPASSWAASSALYHLHLQPELLASLCRCLYFPSDLKKTIKCPWVAAAHGSQSAQPAFLCGAHASQRRQELPSVSPCGNQVVRIEYLNPSVHQFFSVDIDWVPLMYQAWVFSVLCENRRVAWSHDTNAEEKLEL